MIIDLNGNVLQAWFRKDGTLIFDKDNQYGIEFAIAVEYSEEQKKKYAEIKELKKYLKSTDYRALKYADGAYTDEEYAPYKEARAKARSRISELEFEEPTLSDEQIAEAERIAIEKLKESEVDDADS